MFGRQTGAVTKQRAASPINHEIAVLCAGWVFVKAQQLAPPQRSLSLKKSSYLLTIHDAGPKKHVYYIFPNRDGVLARVKEVLRRQNDAKTNVSPLCEERADIGRVSRLAHHIVQNQQSLASAR